jgi:hypothetical protein
MTHDFLLYPLDPGPNRIVDQLGNVEEDTPSPHGVLQ